MRVALCLYGCIGKITDPREHDVNSNEHVIDPIYGYTHYKKHLIEYCRNNDIDMDIYIHSWSIDKADKLNDLYKPKKSIYQKEMEFKLDIENKNHLRSMAMSMKNSLRLAFKSNDVYDCIILSRLDLCLFRSIDLLSFKEDKIYLVNYNNLNDIYANETEIKKKIDDKIIYGNSKLMYQLMNYYKYTTQVSYLNPPRTLYNFFQKMELLDHAKYDLYNVLDFTLVRRFYFNQEKKFNNANEEFDLYKNKLL